MSRGIVFVVAVVTLISLMLPVHAQEDQGPVAEPLPFGPDTSTFYVYGMPDFVSQQNAGCPASVNAAQGATGNTVRPFASNNPDDPCGRPDQPSGSSATNYQRSINALSPISVWFVPAFSAGTPLDTSINMAGEVTLFIEAVVENTPHVGAIKPKISFVVGETTIGSWDGAGEIVDSIQGPETARFYVKYEFDLGAAPETLPEGGGKLVIDVTNSVENQEIRTVAERIGLAVDENRRGHMVLPFTPEAANSFPSPEEPDEDEGNETSGNETTGNETAGNETTGNETGNQTTPTATNTTAANNTTMPSTEESGFLPGFEVVAVVSAALIALAYVSRERRRPPMQVRR